MNKKERKAVASMLDWLFEKVRSIEDLEAKLLELGFPKEYAKWRATEVIK